MRSLQTVVDVLSNPGKVPQVVELLCNSDGMLPRLGGQLAHFQDKELASTLTSANRHLRFLSTPAVAESTSSSSFDPSELRSGKMTVYLVLPPEHMRAQAGLMRMWIGTLIRAVVRGGLQETSTVNLILDEMASVGHMDVTDDLIDKLRGFGLRGHFFFQSAGQVNKCFPNGQDQTFYSNTTQIFFGVNDPETAEYVSKRLGDHTVIVESGGTGSGDSSQSSHIGAQTNRGRSSNASDNWSQVARRLLKPEEVMALDERIAITFVQGLPPIWTRLERYYEGRIGPPRFQGIKTVLATLFMIVMGTFAAMIATFFLRSIGNG